VSFQFKQDEGVQHGLRRIACHQIDRILRDLSGGRRVGRDKAIHEARKRLKRLRALIRLTRGAMGRKSFQRENMAFRETGRPLSALRDAAILVSTFDNLLKYFKGEVSARRFKRVRSKLLLRQRALNRRSHRPGITRIVRELRQAKKRLDDWHLKEDGWDALAGGLQRTYRDGRQAMAKAVGKPSVENLHKWRKRVKDFRHHAELLGPAWPEEIGKLAEDAHHLADLLGDDHDLAVPRETLLKSPDDFGDAAALEPLIALIDARRVELQREAKPLGKRLYAEKPKALEKRLHIYWHAWRTAEEGLPGSGSV
jgi:CHAD domain-containing protein